MIRPESLNRKENKRILNTGGNIGETAGTIAGNFIPGLPPGVGSMVGGTAGRFLGSLLGRDKEPETPATKTNTTMGYKYGGKYKRHLKYNVGGSLPSAAQPIGQDAVRYDGPSHEQGGIPIDEMGNPTDDSQAVAEVEGNETRQGDYIFSDELMVPGSEMTFAEAHEMILAEGGGEEEVEQLAQMQEQVREEEGVAEPQEEPQGQSWGESGMMKKGGKLKKYRDGGRHHQPKSNSRGTVQRTTDAVKGGLKKTGSQARSAARGVGSFFNPRNVINQFTQTPISVPATTSGIPQGKAHSARPDYIEKSSNVKGKSEGLREYEKGRTKERVLRERPGSDVANKIRSGKALSFLGKRAIPAVGAALTATEVGSAGLDAWEAGNRRKRSESNLKSAQRDKRRAEERFGHYSDEEYHAKYGERRKGGKIKQYATGGREDLLNPVDSGRELSSFHSGPSRGIDFKSNLPSTETVQRLLPSATRLASAAFLPDPEETRTMKARTLDERNPAFAAGRNQLASGFRANPTQDGHAQYTQGVNQLASQEAQDRTRREQFNAQAETRADQFNIQSEARDNEMQAQSTARKVGLVDEAVQGPLDAKVADRRGKQQMIANVIASTNQVPVEDRERTLITNLRAMGLDEQEIQNIVSDFQRKYGGKIKKK